MRVDTREPLCVRGEREADDLMGADRLGAEVAAVDRDAVDVRGPLIGADEDQPLAVRGPRRRQRLRLRSLVRHHRRSDRAVPLAGEVADHAFAGLAAAAAEEEDAHVLRRRPDGLRDAVARDLRAVR